MEENIINYSHVNIYQSKTLVLSDVNMELKAGEFIYLIGKTGTGKSSFIKTLYGEVSLKEGDAFVCGYDMKKIKKSQIHLLRRKIGIVFQDFQLLNDRNVQLNLDFVWNHFYVLRSSMSREPKYANQF